jgi:hypothetical protein
MIAYSCDDLLRAMSYVVERMEVNEGQEFQCIIVHVNELNGIPKYVSS